jgi:hypothetical protein
LHFEQDEDQMSIDAIPQRYQPTYRRDEIQLVIDLACRGESLGFVGVAGVGKSNLVNYLRDLGRHAPQLRQDGGPVCFPIVDARHWDHKPGGLWKLMLDALSKAEQGLLLVPREDVKIIPISDEERALNRLQAHLERLCQNLKYRVMFVLDDFDEVFKIGPAEMIERLSGLRSEGNRGYLSYLVITKRLPHVLGRSYNLENDSKFYDLFRRHLYSLEPYNREDAQQMLVHLNSLVSKPLSSRDLTQIRALAGGHAGLLKTVFDIWLEEHPQGNDLVDSLAHKSDVRQECRRVLVHLHEQEQQVAVLVARGQHTQDHQHIVNHLVCRGLLSESGTWFSPLFQRFLVSYKG